MLYLHALKVVVLNCVFCLFVCFVFFFSFSFFLLKGGYALVAAFHSRAAAYSVTQQKNRRLLTLHLDLPVLGSFPFL